MNGENVVLLPYLQRIANSLEVIAACHAARTLTLTNHNRQAQVALVWLVNRYAAKEGA